MPYSRFERSIVLVNTKTPNLMNDILVIDREQYEEGTREKI